MNEKTALRESADQLFQAGDHARALELYQELCRIAPQNAGAWHRQAVTSSLLGDMENALHCCKQALAIRSEAHAIHAHHGQVLMALGQHKEALQAFNNAIRLDPGDNRSMERQGKLYEKLGNETMAEQCYRKAIAVTPGFADAWCSLAGLRHRNGDTTKAIQYCERALATSPEHHEALLAMLEYQLCEGNTTEADCCLENIARRLNRAPHHLHQIAGRLHGQHQHNAVIHLIRTAAGMLTNRPNAFLLLADSLIKTGESVEAIPILQEFEDSQEAYDAYLLLATIYQQQDKPEGAERYLEKASADWPGEAQPFIQRSRIRLENGDPAGAQRCLAGFLAEYPNSAAALVESGYQHYLQGHYEQAAELYRKAVSADPSYAPAHNNLGMIHQQYGRNREAEACYRRAMELDPGLLSAPCNLAFQCCSRGHYDEAIQHYQQVLEKDPRFDNAISGISVAFERQGKKEEAFELVATLVQRGVDDLHTLMAYARTSPAAGMEAQAIQLLEQAMNVPQAPPADRMQACFLLGKLYDSTGDYHQAFDWYSRGNAMNRFPFDREEHQQAIEAIQAVFSAEGMNRLPRSSNTTDTPLFIVGMPRSGTTLTEQIMAAHPNAFGAGELTRIRDIANSIPGLLGSGKPFPLDLPRITAEILDPLSFKHLEYLKNISDDSPRVIDKLPSNFMLLGLIELLFPNARILHCVRDPLDTCLSCYFQQFAKGQTFSYNQSDLASYYRSYRKIMDHWHTVLNLPIMEVCYEELVQDQEQVSKRILDFAGLDWDTDCLDFHQSDRIILTASYDQVRKPIYRSSVKHWENYREQLSVLRHELGEYCPE